MRTTATKTTAMLSRLVDRQRSQTLRYGLTTSLALLVLVATGMVFQLALNHDSRGPSGLAIAVWVVTAAVALTQLVVVLRHRRRQQQDGTLTDT